MSILSTLSKFGAALALTTSLIALPAAAQSISGHSKASVHKANFKGGKFRGHRGGSFRGHRGFKGSRGFRGSRGFKRNNFRGRGFNRGFNRGFKGNRFRGGGFNRGFKGNKFHGGFNRGFKGNRFHGGFNRGFRGNRFHGGFNRGFKGNRFHGGGFGAGVVHKPVYAVGGFYNVHSGSVFITDFKQHGLYAPPRGYRWVCDKGSNDAVLAAVATGAIIAVAAGTLATPY